MHDIGSRCYNMCIKEFFMIISRIILCWVLFFPVYSYSVECIVPQLDDSITVTEHLMSFVTKFSVELDSGSFGTIKKKIFSFASEFNWISPEGVYIASAKTSLFSWGVRIEVFDCNEQKIGTIKEKIFQRTINRTEYSILDRNDFEVATSEKFEVGANLKTSILLKDNAGSDVAELERDWFSFTDKWQIDIYDHSVVDPRILIMLGVFKTDADNMSDDDE